MPGLAWGMGTCASDALSVGHALAGAGANALNRSGEGSVMPSSMMPSGA